MSWDDEDVELPELPAPPIYYRMDKIARLLSRPDDLWTTKRTTRFMRRRGAAVKRGGRWVTTPDLLRETFPEIYDGLLKESL